MSRPRNLKLNKETLAELVTDELGNVVGASGLSCGVCVTACTSCASDFQQCITGHGCVQTVVGCVATADTAC